MTGDFTVRKPCNHTLHLILTLFTCGMWGIFVWPFAAMAGRRETVRFNGYPAAPMTGPYPPQAPPVPVQPPANAVNPYNGNPYYDPHQGARQIQYPPSHPVNYGR